jgi:hypothetical protein
LAYRVFDVGVTLTYQRASLDSANDSLSRALAILPVVAKPGASKDDVVTAARLSKNGPEPFEKNGTVWVGWLGLKFDGQGRFIKAVAGSDEN